MKSDDIDQRLFLTRAGVITVFALEQLGPDWLSSGDVDKIRARAYK